MYPTRRALTMALEHLNGQSLFYGCGLTDSGGSALAALPLLMYLTLRAKNRNIICPNRIEVKVLQSFRRCGPGVSKGAALIAGAINSAPLGRLLLVLFLAKQEKYISFPVVCTKKHREPKLPVHPAIAVTHQFMTCTKRQVGCRSRPLLLPTSIYRQSVDGRSANRKGN